MITQKQIEKLFSYNPKTGAIRIKNTGNSRTKISQGLDHHGSIRFTVNGRHYPGQQIAWMYHYGPVPVGGIKRKNGIKNDNRISNLIPRKGHHFSNMIKMEPQVVLNIGDVEYVINPDPIEVNCLSRMQSKAALQKAIDFAAIEFIKKNPDVDFCAFDSAMCSVLIFDDGFPAFAEEVNHVFKNSKTRSSFAKSLANGIGVAYLKCAESLDDPC